MSHAYNSRMEPVEYVYPGEGVTLGAASGCRTRAVIEGGKARQQWSHDGRSWYESEASAVAAREVAEVRRLANSAAWWFKRRHGRSVDRVREALETYRRACGKVARRDTGRVFGVKAWGC